MLFIVAAISIPKEGEKEAIVLAPTPVVARDLETARIAAARMMDGDIDMDRVQVLARPF
jgi:ribosomal protein L16/L10AE